MKITRRQLRRLIINEVRRISEAEASVSPSKPYTARDVRNILNRARYAGVTALGTNSSNDKGLIVVLSKDNLGSPEKAVNSLQRANYDAKILSNQEIAGLDLEGGSAGFKLFGQHKGEELPGGSFDSGDGMRFHDNTVKDDVVKAFREGLHEEGDVIFVDLAGSGAAMMSY